MTYWNGAAWETERPAAPPPRRRSRRFLGAATEATLITLLMFGLIASTALAAPGGKGEGGGGGKRAAGTIELVVLDGSDATANHTERVGFTVSTSATDRPFVGVRCWQGASFVLDSYTGYFPTYMGDPWVVLDSSYWAAGAEATCTARLFFYDRRGNQNVMATVSFAAAP